MTNVLNFPAAPKPDVIDETFFEKFEDAALMLMVFETLADAVEVVEEGGQIHKHDDSHIGMIEACMGLAVMFRRRTGHDVQGVSVDHLAHQRQCLLEGVELTSLPIPLRPAALSPLPTSAFRALPTVDLARVGFNYASRSHEHIKANSPSLVELDLARAHSLDAMGALVVLIERLTGGVSSIAGANATTIAPGSETLQ